MMDCKKLLGLSFFAILFFGQMGNLYAQTNDKNDGFYLSPVQNPRIIADFPLDLAFLAKIEAVQNEIIAKSVQLSTNDTGNDDSINGLISAIEKNIRLKSILDQQKLTAKDYVVGYMALQASLAAVSSLEDKESIFDESETVSKQNIDFAKANTKRIRELLEKSL